MPVIKAFFYCQKIFVAQQARSNVALLFLWGLLYLWGRDWSHPLDQPCKKHLVKTKKEQGAIHIRRLAYPRESVLENRTPIVIAKEFYC